MAKNQTIVEKVENIIGTKIAELGYLLWNTEFVKEGSEYYLRITIDSENGCDLDDCEKVSKAIDPILDEYDPIEQPYNLEVSSPGLERDICKPWHYELCIGENIDVKLFSPDEYGTKLHTGILKSYNDEYLIIDENGLEVKILNKNIGKSNIHFDYSEWVKKEGK